MDFPTFSKGTNASHGYGRVTSINKNIKIDNLDIRPNQLYHADVNGCVHIPEIDLKDLVEACEEVLKKEELIINKYK